jgi:hypothetical protein
MPVSVWFTTTSRISFIRSREADPPGLEDIICFLGDSGRYRYKGQIDGVEIQRPNP